MHKSFEWDTFKLMNFYLVFPHLLQEIKPLPVSLGSYRKSIKEIPSSYVEIANPKRTLFDLSVLQNMAANHMAAKNIVNLDFQSTNRLKSENYDLSSKLIDSIEADPIRKKPWFKLIVDELPLLDLRGKNGLKKRSGLLEYQYDLDGKQA